MKNNYYKTIDRNATIEVYRTLSYEEVTSGTNNLYAYIDLKTGDVALTQTRRSAKHLLPIGRVDFRKVNVTKSNIYRKATELRNLLREYEKNCFITKGKVISMYGAGYAYEVNNKALIKYVDNPYYKCAEPMRLYDRHMLQFKKYGYNFNQL